MSPRRAVSWVSENRYTAGWLVVGAVFLSWIGIQAYILRSDVTILAESNNRALCALRHQAEVSVDQSQDFLRDHPNGTADFPRELFVRSIRNQQRTVVALRFAKCD